MSDTSKSKTEGAICALFGSGEDTSGLDDVLSTNGGPVDVGGVLLLEDRDGLALNPELAILGLDATLEAAVDGIVLEHVDHVLKVDEGANGEIHCQNALKHIRSDTRTR